MEYKALKYIILDKEALNKASELDKRTEIKVSRLAKSYFKGKTFRLNRQNPAVKLATALKAAEFTLEYYRKKNIPDAIYADTLNDIAVWCRNCGNVGLENTDWLKNHIGCKLFKIGRLQYQMFRCLDGTLKYSELPFSYGDRMVYIHIPQGEKLTTDKCKASLKQANRFFAEYFPDFSYDCYFCQSWLLYGNNVEFMDAESNIVKFMGLFDIHYSLTDEKQAFERIFGVDGKTYLTQFGKSDAERRVNISLLPRNTSLQKSAVNYISAGRKLGVGIATIKKDTV